ncbi:MAG: L-lysine dehydrogenase [Alphaproteobacteria bacterium]|nr:L-lysine dehydrogenase [Alphaproteobacteria bacterium]
MKKIAVLGLGNVGLLAAKLLHSADFEVIGLDARPPAEALPFTVKGVDVTEAAMLGKELAGVDAVLSCLPFALNVGVATAAHGAGIHYFDLTEDVPTTQAIMALAATSKGLMAPQCGLAPGYVGIIGASHVSQFTRCRSIRMRVGALPQNPTGLMGYAFNWSSQGVVNEYLNDCEVIEEGKRKKLSSMEWCETLYIDGVQLEAFTTSGGLGTMCETYLGRVDNVDYKTIRYPGHVKLMNFFFHELLMRERREIAGEILVNAKPPVKDDVVYIHVASEGEIAGRLQRIEFVRAYRPIDIAGGRQTAIAWTTAGSVVAVIELVANGVLARRGFLRQEDVGLSDFLATRTGALFA